MQERRVEEPEDCGVEERGVEERRVEVMASLEARS